MAPPEAPQRVLAMVPAYNEAVSLPALIQRFRMTYPGFDVPVVGGGPAGPMRDTPVAVPKYF